ncbi:MAG: cell wall hydrolase [Butyribacter sp.]|nr:cell wall hydrolase [bacterium]MDY3854455.1 cell wall hydrolase [Butyribacter sp.]
MNKIIKGAITIVTTTGLVMGIPNDCMALAQAPVQKAVIEKPIVGSVSESKIALLPNPVLRTNQDDESYIQAFAVQTSQTGKTKEVTQQSSKSKQEEKRKAKKLRQKRLAAKKAKQEAKRKKEIQACCGVAAGSKDTQILERIVEAEAGGEDYKGKLLVANVILNRVKNKSFPKTIEGVVFAHRGSRYQFSPIADGRYYQVSVSKGTKKAVAAALKGKDPSQGALYFMERSSADSSNVSWFDTALTRLFRYGCHEFYK